MLDRFETDEGRARYAKRKFTTEPDFENVKSNLRRRRFSVPGLPAVDSLRRHDHAAECLAALDVCVCRGGFRERERLVDYYP